MSGRLSRDLGREISLVKRCATASDRKNLSHPLKPLTSFIARFSLGAAVAAPSLATSSNLAKEDLHAFPSVACSASRNGVTLWTAQFKLRRRVADHRHSTGSCWRRALRPSRGS